MNKKSLILTALIINLTICVTFCIGVFTEKGSSDTGKKEIKNETGTSETENSWDTTSAYKDLEIGEETGEETVVKTEEDTTIEEKQTVTDETPPVTYNLSIETTTQETATAAPEETVAVNGTTAVINNSCNIHSVADTGNNIGVANAGTSYQIDPSKCTSNWTAIILPDGSTGYVATSFCTIK